MPSFTLRAIVPKEALLDPAKLIRVIEGALDVAAKDVRMEFARTTGNWNHKPTFTVDSKPGSRAIYTDDEIYFYVSAGTPPHAIRPRYAKRLHFFRTGFRAKSRPNSLTANKGRAATKDETFSRGVMHPGTQARNFDTTIQMRWRKFFPQEIQRAIDTEFTRGG